LPVRLVMRWRSLADVVDHGRLVGADEERKLALALAAVGSDLSSTCKTCLAAPTLFRSASAMMSTL
jgi:hypothetical protein